MVNLCLAGLQTAHHNSMFASNWSCWDRVQIPAEVAIEERGQRRRIPGALFPHRINRQLPRPPVHLLLAVPIHLKPQETEDDQLEQPFLSNDKLAEITSSRVWTVLSAT